MACCGWHTRIPAGLHAICWTFRDLDWRDRQGWLSAESLSDRAFVAGDQQGVTPSVCHIIKLLRVTVFVVNRSISNHVFKPSFGVLSVSFCSARKGGAMALGGHFAWFYWCFDRCAPIWGGLSSGDVDDHL